ncbi:MAG: AAA-like domain-containing protein [Leptolyngbyaceae cyanobacterium bins.349]|nr:AAA-like domain-containing protein [Leptolyngbyaceae cyanobacterium bins.349]
MNAALPPQTILFLAANPQGSSPLQLGKEAEDLRAGLERSRNRDRFLIEQRWAVTPTAIRRALLDCQPRIVHFSGHGVGTEVSSEEQAADARKLTVVAAPSNLLGPEGLMFEDATGQPKLVSGDALASLFELFADQIECVVLNACYSENQAQTIAQHIPYVVGMKREIGDKAAIEFAIGFYDALLAGRSIEFAYKLGCSAVQMAGIPEHLTPQLVPKPGGASTAAPGAAVPTAATPVAIELEDVGGQVPVESPFYVERPPIEPKCFEAITKPGALIRIKAPRQMGKSSLMIRILDHATKQGYKQTWLNLQSVEDDDLEDLDKFLKWLCSRVSRKLKIKDAVAEYWEGSLGSNDKCTFYFEEHLLEQIDAPFALCLDEVDELFKHEHIATDFLGLLRSWHEESKINPLWRKLRLIITHSKEVYIPLNINQSPFNVGLSIELPPLKQDQMQDLIQRHGLMWSASEIGQLIALTGGHPYLARVALYAIASGEMTLTQIMGAAATQEGIYGDHLRRQLANLQDYPDLVAAMKQVIAVDTPVRMNITQSFKLASMGLVKFQGNDVVPLCDLYRWYFQEMLRG